MSPFVLDASLSLAWLFEDERSEAAGQVLDVLYETHAYVPSVWCYEVGNALLRGLRRGRIAPLDLDNAASLIDSVRIHVVEGVAPDELFGFLEAAQSERLNAYDMAYLSLAHTLDIPLATLDQPLRAAAIRNGVAVIPE